MPRNLKIALAILGVAVLIGLISLRGLDRRIQRLSEGTTTEEQARRDLLSPGISTPTDVKIQTKIYWAAGPEKVAAVQVGMDLSADPLQRAKQVLNELIANPPAADQRTIPEDTTLLGFYILPDGTAIADFSDALASETPSGILSEEMAIDSIRLTLANSLPGLSRLKILIHGQEVDTLAGHIDLTGFFDLTPPTARTSPDAPATPPPAPSKK
ncbi:MAG TPA: GerMN domain-containing protein [Candidatus Acidoferrales bacterium]|nr:GerMN domain-containing protein [Candidatus Acidoferrales bacterium]